jgi:hypothetical protein
MVGLILTVREFAAEVAEEVAWHCEEIAHGLPDGMPATLVKHAADAAHGIEGWLASQPIQGGR